MRTKDTWAIDDYVLSRAKEWEGAWCFKGEEGDLQVEKKTRYLVVRCLSRHADTSFR